MTPPSLNDRIAALEAAPRLALVYEVVAHVYDGGDNARSESILATFDRAEADARATAEPRGFQRSGTHVGRIVERVEVKAELAVLFGAVVQVVQLGRLLTASARPYSCQTAHED